jgi:hypothetical protein
MNLKYDKKNCNQSLYYLFVSQAKLFFECKLSTFFSNNKNSFQIYTFLVQLTSNDLNNIFSG